MACGHGNLLTLGCCTSWHQLAPAGPSWSKVGQATCQNTDVLYPGLLKGVGQPHASRWSFVHRVLLKLTNIPFMSQWLEYQERFNQLAHESVINAMVVSLDGRWLVSGSDDSTVLVWSTQSGVILCRLKAHSPVLSLAWVRNSRGFIFGCKNGTLASVDITEV